jgi:2-amino-4-hydroxy-6-hydroxymethyldihydropteridine diphosphokinase
MAGNSSDTSSGTSAPGSKTVYIALGSNVGDRAATLARAVEAMPAAGIRVVRQSSLYMTEATDGPAQAWFLNAVVEAETALMPLQLLRAVMEIERDFGRRRITIRGPRTLDLDILFYGSSIIRKKELEVPHPRMPARRFVLVPLAELAPAMRHPALHRTIAQLLADTPDRSQVRLWRPSDSIGG